MQMGSNTVRGAMMAGVLLLGMLWNSPLAAQRNQAATPDDQVVSKVNQAVRLGPGPDSNSRTVPLSPLSVVSFNARVRSNLPGVKGYSYVNFYDIQGRLLLRYMGGPVSDTDFQNTGYYTEAPALARSMTFGVVKDTAAGYVYVDSLIENLHAAGPLKTHAPLCDLDQYMKPFWKGDTVYNETVLMYASEGGPADGRLLYAPDHILSVQSFDGKTVYSAGTDYSVSGRMITRAPGSGMPFRADTSFEMKKDFAWFTLQSEWVVVTYTHKDAFKGPIPFYKGDRLPRATAKLRARLPLRIVAYGMSITRGMDVSGYDSVAPFMPTYVDLFARGLRQAYGDTHITLLNAGLPGSAVDWGAQYADDYVSPLHPDVVILDFGMNDFWRMTPPEFRDHIKTIMDRIRRMNPPVEFILLSNMQFDPGYLKNSDGRADWYKSNLLGYNTVLQQLEGAGVVNLDMTTLSGYIYGQKKAKDCIVNPLHPNDYLARWYAQGLTALLVQPR